MDNSTGNFENGSNDPAGQRSGQVLIARRPRSFKEIWRLPGGPLFFAVCVVFLLAIAYTVLSKGFGIDLYSKAGGENLRCTFHKLTGLYCPGCGGTRSTLRLLNLDFIGSILLHPIPVYILLLAVNYFVRYIFGYLVPEKCPIRLKPPKLRLLYLFILFGLYMANFALRNILLVCGIDTL